MYIHSVCWNEITLARVFVLAESVGVCLLGDMIRVYMRWLPETYNLWYPGFNMQLGIGKLDDAAPCALNRTWHPRDLPEIRPLGSYLVDGMQTLSKHLWNHVPTSLSSISTLILSPSSVFLMVVEDHVIASSSIRRWLQPYFA